MLNKVFCFRLNTAGIVIGWLGVVASILFIILFTISVSSVHSIAENSLNKYHITIENAQTFMVDHSSILLFIIVVNFVASVMLILGTIKERHLMLLPWLINSGIRLVVGISATILITQAVLDSPSQNGVLVLICADLSLVFHIYIYYGVYSLFKQIQLSCDQQRLQPYQQPQYLVLFNEQDNVCSAYTKV